ncbi:MAG: sulfite exporter TauE/SafE family protein [Paracoccaceae bacterium]
MPDLPDILLQRTSLELSLILFSLFLGGVLKGVTGAGAPIVAIPVIAAIVDLPTAVMIMLVPNALTNIRQATVFRASLPERRFLLPYLAGGAAGVLVGTALLTGLPSRGLDLLVACAILLYVGFRLAKPSWGLSRAVADRLAVPAGAVAGVLQGATGLSAPATLGFLNAVKFARPTFVATVALLFLVFSAVHILSLAVLGVFTLAIAFLSFLALAPILIGMAAGGRLGNRIPQTTFEYVVLTLLAAIALKLLIA